MAGSNNIHIKYPFIKIFSKPPILTYRKLATANYFFQIQMSVGEVLKQYLILLQSILVTHNYYSRWVWALQPYMTALPSSKIKSFILYVRKNNNQMRTIEVIPKNRLCLCMHRQPVCPRTWCAKLLKKQNNLLILGLCHLKDCGAWGNHLTPSIFALLGLYLVS